MEVEKKEEAKYAKQNKNVREKCLPTSSISSEMKYTLQIALEWNRLNGGCLCHVDANNFCVAFCKMIFFSRSNKL